MCSLSPEQQRKRFASFLAHQRTGIISTTGSPGVWAMPVWYRPEFSPTRSHTLDLDCLVPRWSDLAHHLMQEHAVIVIVQASSEAGLRWLQIQGTSRPVEAPTWDRLLPRWISTTQPDALFLVVRVTPSRIDLVDEDLGWGVQETFEW